jgi:NAD+ synthase
MFADLSINPEKISEEIIEFVKKTVQKTGFSRLMVGLSGGLDSATSCALGVKAIGAENIYAGLFPYGKLNEEGLEEAKLLIKTLSIPETNVIITDIKPFVDLIVRTVDQSMDNLRRGNIIVRIRMILFYDLAKKYQALVLGTENKSEYLLGYYTRFGDEASDIAPIRHLYKTQVRQLAGYLKIPEKIVGKTPTAGLWSGQTDEGELGFTYKEADQILYQHVGLKKSKEEIIKSGLDKEAVEKVIGRMEANDFKHKTPYYLASNV